MPHHSYHPQGFTPGSVQSIRAVQMEHRYENKTSFEQQAGSKFTGCPVLLDSRTAAADVASSK
jgi:hypothetical protein